MRIDKMKAAGKKQKGARLERFIAKEFRAAGLDKKASRMPLSGAVDGFKSDVATSLPLSIEAKNQERWAVDQYMQQAIDSTEHTNKMPVVVMSKNRMPDPYIMMRFSDWIILLQRAFIENKLPITTGKQAYSKSKQIKKG